MTVIDIFSKFAWAIPIKNKTGDSITRAFEIIFKDRIPTKLHTDKGLEFINKSTQNLFKRKGIHWFATENETKDQVVERFNRTLKSKMYKYFTAKGTKTWINIIDELVYNQARIQELVKGGHFSKFSSRVAKMSISLPLAYSHGEVYIRMLLAYSAFL